MPDRLRSENWRNRNILSSHLPSNMYWCLARRSDFKSGHFVRFVRENLIVKVLKMNGKKILSETLKRFKNSLQQTKMVRSEKACKKKKDSNTRLWSTSPKWVDEAARMILSICWWSKVRKSGGLYFPSIRNVNAVFLKSFLSGKKHLLKTTELKIVQKQFNFCELSLEKLLNEFPNNVLAKSDLPDVAYASKIDRSYALNVSSPGFKHFVSGIHWRKSPSSSWKSKAWKR